MITHCKNGHEYTDENTRFIKNGKTKLCKKCHAKHQEEWRKANPELWKTTVTKARKKWEQKQKEKFGEYWGSSRHRKRRYGITLDQYNALFLKQNGLCAICHRPETETDSRTGRIKSLHVDHNHETTEIRGLLCLSCNGAIGLMKDNPAILRSGAEYLENPPARGFFSAE